MILIRYVWIPKIQSLLYKKKACLFKMMQEKKYIGILGKLRYKQY